MLETAWGFKSPLAHQAKKKKAPEESGAFFVFGGPSPVVRLQVAVRPGGTARPRHAGSVDPVVGAQRVLGTEDATRDPGADCPSLDRSLNGGGAAPRSVRVMTDSTTPDGSSDPTETQQQYTEDLPDGSSTGDATKDPEQDSDVDSGGEPADPQ